MPKVTILWDLPRSHPSSMDRYAASLGSALRAISAAGWVFEDLVPNDSHVFRRFGADQPLFRRIDDLILRFAAYPLQTHRRSADLYHLVDQGYGQLTRALHGRRVVATCHDLIVLRAEQEAIGFAVSRSLVFKFRWITRGLCYADAIICPSLATKRDVMRFLGIAESRIHVIPNGLDDRFKAIRHSASIAQFRKTLDIPPGASVIVHVSGISPYKNLEGLLRTLAILVRDFAREVHLLRVGGLLGEAHWQLARRLGVADRIHEAGHLTDPELITAYNAANVLLFPSWCEGFGFPPLEAMACGTPVVASDRGSLPEVIGEAGVQLPADDYAGMAKAVCRIFDDPEWRSSLIERGRARSARFRWENTASETLRVYQRVLETNASGSTPS